MPGGKKKDAPASSSKKKKTPPATPAPKRSDTGTSSKSNKSFRDEKGKISPKKVFSSVFGSISSNMTATPSTRKIPVKMPNPPEGSGKGKEIARTKRLEKIRRPAIPIDINSGSQPIDWIMFTVPYDQTNQSENFRWAGSNSYTVSQVEEVRDAREAYLKSVMAKKKIKPFQKADFTVFLRLTEVMAQEADQVFIDVKDCLGLPVLQMTGDVNLKVNLLFDTEADPRLAQDEYIAMTANLVQVAIMTLQGGHEGNVESQIEVIDAEDHDQMMSGAIPNDVELVDHDDTVITRRDYAEQQSGGQIRRAIFDDEPERRGRSREPAPEPHYRKGDARDDEIKRAPKKRR